MGHGWRGRRPGSLVLAAVLSLSGVGVTGSPAMAQQAPDNSGVNKKQPVTADQQQNGASDRETTAKIRRSIVADKSLSTYGHNVKIVTKNGAVTLTGPVHSDAEKQNIQSKAAAVAGQDKVTDQLTVK